MCLQDMSFKVANYQKHHKVFKALTASNKNYLLTSFFYDP